MRAEFKSCKPVALVFGTRPEAVKLAPVARALGNLGIPFKIMVTAQHRELLDQMLSLFDLEVSVDLDLMKPDQTLTDFGGRALTSLGKLFREEKSKYFTEVVDNILYGRCLRNGGCGAYGDKKNGRPIKNRFHVVWVVKERVPLFANSGRYLSYLHDAFLTCGTLLSGKTVLLWMAPDHIHFYLEIPDIEAVGEIVEDLQGIIHDALVEKFIEVRDIAPDDSLLWETSYFLEPID